MSPEEAELIKEGMKITNEWLKKAFGSSVEQLGGMAGDWFRHKRELMEFNRRKVFEKIHTIALEENVTPREISSKILLPMLEGMSLEDDEILQNMWANMFVNYVDSKSNLTVVVYPGILKQLSSNEVKILNYMRSEKRPQLWRYFDGTGPCPYTDEEALNLVRLSLIDEIIDQKANTQKDGAGVINPLIKNIRTGQYQLTEFGDEFLDACQRREIDRMEKIRRKSGRR